MAIPGQANINIGAENQVAGSDNLFEAFHTIQNNFTTLFNASSTLSTFRAGDGIEVSANTSNGVVNINNAGVTKIVAGSGVSVSSANGNVTISAVPSGPLGVTRVGLTSSSLNVGGVSGNIVSTGTFSVDLPRIPTSSSFATGTYVAPNITVDGFGRITEIANGIGVGTVTSVGLTPGKGISVTGGPVLDSGTISVTNTGVTSLQAGGGIRLSGSNGDITISALEMNVGTVTQVGVTSNTLAVTGGTVTTNGNIRIELPQNIAANNLSLTGNADITGNVNAYKAVANYANVVYDLTIGGGQVGGALTFKTQLQGNTGNYVSIIPPPSISTQGLIFMLPNTIGSNTSVLGTDGSGALIWKTAPAAGSNTYIQFNDGNTIGGVANLTFNKSSNLLTTYQLAVTSNANVGNLGTSGLISATGTITAGNIATTGNVTASRLVSNVATGTAPIVVTSTTTVANLSVAAATVAGTVSGAAQSNITSVGTLTSLTSSGNITANNVIANTYIRAIGGLIMDSDNGKYVGLTAPGSVTANLIWGLPTVDGSSNSFISTNGAGQLSFKQPASSSAPSTASSTGVAGQIAYDSSYVYVCVATNTWKRSALTTW